MTSLKIQKFGVVLTSGGRYHNLGLVAMEPEGNESTELPLKRERVTGERGEMGADEAGC